MPEVPGTIPGYTSEMDGVPPASPTGQGVPQGSPTPPESPPAKLADGTDPTAGKVPYDRFKEVNDQNKELAERNAELERLIGELDGPRQTYSFAEEAPQQRSEPQAVHAESAPADDEWGFLRPIIAQAVGEAVKPHLEPVQQFIGQTQQERLNARVERQKEVLSKLVPDFDAQAAEAAIRQDLARRRGNGMGFDDLYLLANKGKLLKMLAMQRQAPAPAASTGHDIGGAPATGDDMSPDRILQMMDEATARGDQSARERWTELYFQKTGMSQQFGF